MNPLTPISDPEPLRLALEEVQATAGVARIESLKWRCKTEHDAGKSMKEVLAKLFLELEERLKKRDEGFLWLDYCARPDLFWEELRLMELGTYRMRDLMCNILAFRWLSEQISSKQKEKPLCPLGFKTKSGKLVAWKGCAAELHEQGLLDERTTLSIFASLFNGETVTTKALWRGSITTLAFFISTLHNNGNGIFDLSPKKHWERTVNCFQVWNEQRGVYQDLETKMLRVDISNVVNTHPELYRMVKNMLR